MDNKLLQECQPKDMGIRDRRHMLSRLQSSCPIIVNFASEPSDSTAVLVAFLNFRLICTELQTRNDARVVVTGSMEAFSNTFLQATGIETKHGDKYVVDLLLSQIYLIYKPYLS